LVETAQRKSQNYAIGAAKDELGVKLAIDQEYEQRLYDERQKVGSR
jgi:hypothetical protein